MLKIRTISPIVSVSAMLAVTGAYSEALAQQPEQPSAATLPPVVVETPTTPKARKSRTSRKPQKAKTTAATQPAASSTTPNNAGAAIEPDWEPIERTSQTDGTTQPFTRQQSVAPQQTLGSNDSARLFQNMAGFSYQTGGGVSALPYLNGLGDDRLKILVNGMTLTSSCANHMNPTLSYIDANAVGKISVSPGVTPVSMGGDSIAGTISVDSPAAVFAEPGQRFTAGGRMSTAYRSNGDGFSASVHAHAATPDASISYTGTTTKADNYKDGSGREVDSTLYKSTNHLVSTAGRYENHRFGVDLGWQSIDYQGFVNQFMDMTDNHSFSINAHYKGTYNWGFLEGRIYRQAIRHSMNMLEDKASLGWDMPMETRGNDSGYAVKVGIDVTNTSQLRVGHEYHRYRLDDWWPPSTVMPMMGPDTFWNINDGRRDRTSVFAELETKLNPAWTTLVGARFERVMTDTGTVQGYNGDPSFGEAGAFNSQNLHRTDNNVDVTATARYEPAATNAFEFGAARKTRSPNLYERYAWSNNTTAGSMVNWFGDLNAYVGNPDLNPEIAYTARASAEWHDAAHRDWHIKVSGYFTHVDDYINVEPNPLGGAPDPGRAKLRFVNHDAQLFGLDLEATTALGYWWGDWRIGGVFSYVHGRDLDADTHLYNIMPANARVSLTHTLGKWSNTVELQAVAAKNRVDEVRIEPRTSAYTLVNVRTSYQLNSIRFDAGVDNVFDTDYELPLGGLSAFAYNYDQTNLDRAKVHGPGRSFNVGMTVEF